MHQNDIITIEGIHYYAPDKRDFIYNNMILNNQIWEKVIVEKLCSFIEKESCSIDVGAHIGSHTIQFSKYSKKVFSFEPLKENYDIFLENMRLNSVQNFILFKKAVTDKKSRLVIDPICLRAKRRNSGASYLMEDEKGEIDGDTLDNFLLNSGVFYDEKISLIKYDVEEMEIYALRGSINTINKFHPILYVEFIKERKRRKTKGKEVYDFLSSIGYSTVNGEREIWEKK